MKEISKTLFKEFSKCSNYYVLDNIYNKKMFSEIDENIKKEYLKLMYDENGNSLICNTDEKLEVMQEYYKEVERVSLKVASKTFKIRPFLFLIFKTPLIFNDFCLLQAFCQVLDHRRYYFV